MKKSNVVLAVGTAALLGAGMANAALPTEATTALNTISADLGEVAAIMIPVAAVFASIGWVIARII